MSVFLDVNDDDIHQILDDIELRKTNFERNMVMQQRDRSLKEISTFLDCVRNDGYDSDLLKIRQLVSQQLKSAEAEIQTNVEKEFKSGAKQETRAEAIIPSSVTYARTTGTKKLPKKLRPTISLSSRLLQARSSSCDRCQAKHEQQQQRCPAKKSELAKRPATSLAKIAVTFPARNRPQEPETVIPTSPSPPLKFPRLPQVPSPKDFTWLRKQLNADGLRPELPTLLSRYPVDIILDDVRLVNTKRRRHKRNESRDKNLVMIPLGLKQSDVTSRRLNALSRPLQSSINSGNAGITIAKGFGADDSVYKSETQTLTIQQLPSVNIKSLHVEGRHVKPESMRSNTRYLEFQASDDMEPQKPQDILTVPTHDTGHLILNSPINNSEYPVETVRQIIEDELVELLFAELNMAQPKEKDAVPSLLEIKGHSPKNPSMVTTVDAATEPKSPVKILEDEKVIIAPSERNSSIASPNHIDIDCDPLIATPDVTPTFSPLPDSGSPPPPPRTPTPSPMSSLLPEEIPDTHATTPAEQRISTPTSTAESATSSNSLVETPESAKLPREFPVEDTGDSSKTSKNSLQLKTSPRHISVRPSENFVKTASISVVSNRNQSDRSELEDEFSLGQVRLVPLQTLLRLMRHGRSVRVRTPNDDSSDAADDLDSDQDVIDLTSSTTLSEGEVRLSAPLSVTRNNRLAMLNDYLSRRSFASGDARQAMATVLHSGDVGDGVLRRFLKPTVEPSPSDGLEPSLGEVGRLNRTMSSEDGRISMGEAFRFSSASSFSYGAQDCSRSEGEILLPRD